MSGARRAVLLVGIAVVAAAGFVLLRDAGDSADGPVASGPAATATTGAATTGAATTGANTTGGDAPARTTSARPAAPAVPRIVVRGGEPVGGVRTLRFRAGETIRFEVIADAPDEVHLHVYDAERPVAPGRPARFALRADVEGVFELELHGSHVQIGAIAVEP